MGRSISRCKRWHYSFQTFLIATSVIVALLGIAVYLDD